MTTSRGSQALFLRLTVAAAVVLPAAALLATSHHHHGQRPAAASHGSTRSAAPIVASAVLPRDIKEVTNQLRGSVQAGLQARLSRMDVDLPIGADFGIERGEKRRKAGVIGAEDVVRSDRELARLFVEMFDGTGIKPLVVFSDEAQAKRAKELWPGVEARVAALGGASPPAPPVKQKKVSKKKSGGGGGGFGAAAAAPPSAAPTRALSAVPPATEVLFAVRPGPAQLDAIRAFSEASGMDRLVVLLNARVDTLPAEYAPFAESFTNAYTFVTDPTGAAAAAQKEGGGGGGADAAPAVLWRAYPDEWVVATKPKLGPPKQVATLSSRPSTETIDAAIEEARGSGGLLDAVGLGNVF